MDGLDVHQKVVADAESPITLLALNNNNNIIKQLLSDKNKY